MGDKLTAIIDRFEENKAVLTFPDGQTLILPIEHLPEGAAEGGVLNLTFGEDRQEEKNREQLAKEMLNELLKKSD